MIEKNKILESWIMVEHLSEGDIGLNDKAILTLNDLQEQDFYSLFLHKIEKKKWNRRQKGGVVVYFDIFKFQEVVDILHAEYGLEATDEDIRFGDKFSFALYFDKNLNFLEDMTFFTESAYIRKFKKVPYEKEFREFEKDFKNQLAQDFDETAGDSAKFNAAMQKELLRHEVNIINCRMKILGNIETEATNLHSFFIDDLEKAKKIETVNLNAYLYGNKKERMNLDSKKDSVNFHPHLFEQILQPKNYPLGRFPSNTTYALSLMQQVAVNLSIGFDNNQMRSVNGPPGTGKTTLLKDIFAQLVVQQAYSIAKLSDHFIKGTEKTIYFNHASIGEIPEHIIENNIVVASSNNGAVQNIVNELPLSKEIDNFLINELKEADYFCEISNAKVSVEWLEDENGKKREELVKESVPGEEKFWGVFSLEGGKANNMSNILTNMKHIHKYLEEDYLPNQGIYKQFLSHYEEVKAIRTKRQEFADSVRMYQEYTQKMEQVRGSYQEKLEKKEHELCVELAFFKMVQNKLHYAAHGHTAAEVIYERADASQPFMGLKSFSGDFPVLKDISIAKKYLNDEELKILNNIVSGYFDFAEIQAMRHNPMHMEDYVEHLDNVLKTTDEKVLQGAGTISHAQAIEKATEEYRKYQVQNLSPVEEEYLESIKNIHSTVKKNSKN